MWSKYGAAFVMLFCISLFLFHRHHNLFTAGLLVLWVIVGSGLAIYKVVAAQRVK